MIKTITINGKDYQIKKFDFNALCDLEELGCGLQDAEVKGISFIRGLIAWVMGVSLKKAGQEIQEHLEKGGSIEDFTVIMEALETSDFFKSLQSK